MPKKPRELEKEVLKAGFVRVRSKGRGSHRRYEHPDGRTTEIPFHSNEIRKRTENDIKKQAGI